MVNKIYIEILYKLGISIGDRKYEFVAFSSSQLRDSSCWFFESTRNGINPQSILRSLGKQIHLYILIKQASLRIRL